MMAAITQDHVIELLDTAVDENGYTEMLGWSDKDIAVDLLSYCVGFEDIEIDNPDLMLAIQAWKKKHRKEDASA